MTNEMLMTGAPGGESSDLLDTDEGLAALRLFGEYSDSLLNFGAASCIIFMVVGIPGNLITIISLARYKKVRNATAIFIINMSVADLLFGCINLPLAASTFLTRSWYHGVFMCSFFVFSRFALAGVSLFTVLAITLNRYIMISHPRLYPKLFTNLNLGIIVAFTWILSILTLVPTWAEVYGRFGMDRQTSFCIVLKDKNGNSPMKSIFISAFVIPFLTITICYMRIFWIVRKTNKKARGSNIPKHRSDIEDSSFGTSEPTPQSESVGNKHVPIIEHPRLQSIRPPSSMPQVKITIPTENRSTSLANIFNIQNMKLRKSRLLARAAPTSKDKRLLTLITAIMITFFVFHLPITILKVCHEIAIAHPTAIIWSYLLRYFTTCVNPIIYVVMSHEYRKAYKKAFVMPSCSKNILSFGR